MRIVDDVAADRPSLFLASRMKRLAERMQAQSMVVIRAADLPVQPSNVLLLALIYENGPQTVGGLAAALKLSQPTVTRAIAALAELKVVTLDRGRIDQRQRSVSLTDEGRSMWERAEREVWTPLERVVDGMRAGMDADLVAGLLELEVLLEEQPMDERVRRAAARPEGAAPDKSVPIATPRTGGSPGRTRRRLSLRWASTLGDFELCFGMLKAHIAALQMPEATTSYLDTTAASIQQVFSGERAGLLIAEIDGEPAGMLAFQPFDADRAKLNYLYVASLARGQGLGRSLLSTVLSEIRAEGFGEVVLATLPKLKAAQALYAFFGFSRTAWLFPDLSGAEYYSLRLSGRS